MCARRVELFVFVAMLCGPPLAQAQAPVAKAQAPSLEVTPFAALGSGGVSPVGVAVAFPLTRSLALETEADYRRGEGRIHALSLNASVLYNLPRLGSATPYLAGGAGLREHGTAVVPSDGGSIGTQPRVALTVNAGGGLKVPVKNTWDLRTDARWFKSFGREGGEHFRVAQGIAFDVGRR